MSEIELVVQLIFQQFIVDANLFLCVLFAPFQGSEAVAFLQCVNVSQFSRRWLYAIKNLLVFVSYLPENLLLFLFVSVIGNMPLLLEFSKGIIQSKQLICAFLMKGFGFGNRARFSFLNIGLDAFDNSFSILLIVFDFGKFFLFEISDIL